MTGGILQLVARGINDMFIIGDPEITFFKTVYRRHTNFSRGELDIGFESALGFGKEAVCRIQRWGDLLHRLFLVINLPPIDIRFKCIRIFEVVDKLSKYGINWKVNELELGERFTSNHYDEVLNILSKEIHKENKLIKSLDSLLLLFEEDKGGLYYKKFINGDIDKYQAEVLKVMVNSFGLCSSNDKDEFMKIIHESDKNEFILGNADTIYESFKNNILDKTFGSDKVFKDLVLNFNQEGNIKELQESVDSIIANYILQQRVYNSMKGDSKFIFYKISGCPDDFVNLSMLRTNQVQFSDNFTARLICDITNDDKSIISSFHNIIKNGINKFHDDNKSMFNNAHLIEYFQMPELWNRLSCLNKLTFKKRKQLDISGKIFGKKKIAFLNYLPLLINLDIPIAIKRYLKSREFESVDVLVDIINGVGKDVENKLIDKLVNEDDFETIEQIVKYFGKNDQLIITAIIRPYVTIDHKSRRLSLMDYVFEKYIRCANKHFSSEIRDEILDIINLFRYPVNELPDYKKYLLNNCNIRRDKCINFQSKKKMLCEVASSVWYEIYCGFASKYNSLYNNVLLSKESYDCNVDSKNIKSLTKCQTLYFSNGHNYFYDGVDKKVMFEINAYYHRKIDETVKRIDAIYDLIEKGISDNFHLINKKEKREKYYFESFDSIIKTIHKKHGFSSIDIDKVKTPIDIISKFQIEVSASELYNIKDNYNGFCRNSDVFRYIKDRMLHDFSLGFLIDLKSNTVKGLYKEILERVTGERQRLMDRVNCLNDLMVNIEKMSLTNNSCPRFAWVKYIGHYLIDYVKIRINDQIIDVQTGEWLQFWHQLVKKDTKERGYNKIIGNVPELFEFNNEPKRGYQLKVPLQFWFCKFLGSALPMVSLNHSEIDIIVRLKEFNEVAYYDCFTEFKDKIDVSCNLIAEYIYVETEERMRMATSKMEYLIEQVQSNGLVVINKDSLDCDWKLRQRLFFENPCKEIVWALQDVNFIDGSAPFGERKYYNYTMNFDNETVNPARCAKIDFNTRTRESYKKMTYYDKIVPYSRHFSTPSEGINNYSFSLRPELPIPTGSANLSKIDEVDIEMILREFDCTRSFKLSLYLTSYNILRIFSGLAGLAFYK